MNHDTFFEKFELLSDTPNAVGMMREFILHLAIRGKLIPQDSRDEPASFLLERIRANRLANSRKRSQFSAVPDDTIVPPFEVPDTWAWTKLGEIAEWGAGSTPSRGNSELYGGDIIWLKSGELNDNQALCDSEEKITELALQTGTFRRNQPGDVLIAMYGATIGKVAILARSAVTNQAVCGCTTHSGVFNKYLFFFLYAQRASFHAASEGGAQPNISKVKIVAFPFPLPPLAEQKRIVAKVDELMALCDRLEAQQKERDMKKAALVQASLIRFTDAPTSTNLEFLFHKSYAVEPAELRTMIFELAFHGCFKSEGDASEQTGKDLYDEIIKIRGNLEASKTIKKVAFRPMPEIEPFPIPSAWSWTTLGAVFDVRDGTHDTPKYVDCGYPLITSKNISSGRLSFDDVQYISEFDHIKIKERSQVDVNDVLFAMIGSIGNPVIVDTDLEFSIKNVALFKYFSNKHAEPKFLLYYLQFASGTMRKQAAGAVQSFVSLGFLRNYPFPLPSLPEQKRIVAKIEDLMALVDKLEAQAASSREAGTKLLEAVVAEIAAAA